MRTSKYLKKMRQDWDERARHNARFYIADSRGDWTEEDFRSSGNQTVAEDILTDMANICQGKDPQKMRVLELGCGAGRVTRALANVFGEVHAVDVSPEMVLRARAAVSRVSNVRVHEIDGAKLDPLGALTFDFAYSCCVFHHISSVDVIRSLVREVGKRLKPGALFKFEVQGATEVQSAPGDTWLGAPFSLKDAEQLASDCGFELRFHAGEGQERFWLWFFRKL